MNPELRPLVEQLEWQSASFKTLNVLFNRFLNDSIFPSPKTPEDQAYLLDSMSFLAGVSDLIEHYYNKSEEFIYRCYHPKEE